MVPVYGRKKLEPGGFDTVIVTSNISSLIIREGSFATSMVTVRFCEDGGAGGAGGTI